MKDPTIDSRKAVRPYDRVLYDCRVRNLRRRPGVPAPVDPAEGDVVTTLTYVRGRSKTSHAGCGSTERQKGMRAPASPLRESTSHLAWGRVGLEDAI